MTRLSTVVAAVCGLLCGVQGAVGQTEPPKSPPIPDAPAVNPKEGAETKVRQKKGWRNDERTYHGVVESIDKEKMVFVGKSGTNIDLKVYRYTFHPIDLLADGKVIEDNHGMDAYRWQDVKVGDSLEVTVSEDREELQRYVVTIHISRRPGDKLPPSQNMKKYPPHDFEMCNVYNDIDNGLDVTEDEITRLFPAKWFFEKGQQPKLLRQGGLSEEYRKKLALNRAKIAIEKEKKVLKAPPPDKK